MELRDPIKPTYTYSIEDLHSAKQAKDACDKVGDAEQLHLKLAREPKTTASLERRREELKRLSRPDNEHRTLVPAQLKSIQVRQSKERPKQFQQAKKQAIGNTGNFGICVANFTSGQNFGVLVKDWRGDLARRKSP